MRLKLQRIDINHDLPITPAEGLWYGCSGNVGDLVSNVISAKVLQLCFVEALPLQGDKANGKARSVEFENDRRERTWWQAAEVGHGQIGNGAQVGVGVGASLKVDFDEADTRQGARFDVIHTARQREPPLKGVGDVGFHLFGWHAGIKRRDDHHGNIDRREKIDRHARQGNRADDGDEQANHNEEVGVFDGEPGHQLPPSVSGAPINLGWTLWPERNSLRFPMITRSPSDSPESTSTRELSSSPSLMCRSSMVFLALTLRTVASSPLRTTASSGSVSAFAA